MKRAGVRLARFLFGLRRPAKAANASLLRERGETVATLRIRDATAADIPELARLHVTTWNDTYNKRGPTRELREWQWREAFQKNDGSWFCLVVERSNSELIGFAKGRRSDHPEFGGELNKIYLLREYQRLGLGRRLVGHVARRFLDQGITSMWLYSEAGNPSGAFYEALGGDNMRNDDGTMNYGNYQWRDLRALAAICPTE
jgi:ribosomal protein S18 acetylase RimI-like enzyme